MTPDAKPFYAGTYFPPEPRHGIPSFPELLRAVAETWRERRDDIERQASADRRHAALDRGVGAVERAAHLVAPLRRSARDRRDLRARLRWLRPRAEVPRGVDARAPPPARRREVASRWSRHTLDGMAAGGFYDVVGGGFHRYSVDDRWLVPHFEKMLYDNAVLASTYLHAWVVTGRERYREIVEETLGYMLRELVLSGGAFASAHDADTEGVEGLTYTWTPEEAAAVGLPQDVLEPFEHGRLIASG